MGKNYILTVKDRFGTLKHNEEIAESNLRARLSELIDIVWEIGWSVNFEIVDGAKDVIPMRKAA